MGTVVLAIEVALWLAVWLFLLFGWRLFPKYRKGTAIIASVGGDDIRCAYLYRRYGRFHRVRVLPGDDLCWDGRVLTVPSRDLKAVQS